MMIKQDFLQQRKKQKYLIGVVVVFLVLTVYVVYTGFFKKAEEIATTGENEAAVTTSFQKDIKINFDVFKNPILEQLEPFEEIPPLSGQEVAGRTNPFTPY